MNEVEFHREPPTNVPTLVVAFGGWVDAGEAALASRIGQRRNTKALDERNPSCRVWCTSSVNGRIYMGFLRLKSLPHFLIPCVRSH